MGGSGVAQEAGAEGPDEDLLEHVEGDVGDGEELSGVGDGEADVGYGKEGKVRGAEGEVFGLGVWELVVGLERRGGGEWDVKNINQQRKRTAQIPRTTRDCQGLAGWGGTEAIVEAISSMTRSASLSSFQAMSVSCSYDVV